VCHRRSLVASAVSAATAAEVALSRGEVAGRYFQLTNRIEQPPACRCGAARAGRGSVATSCLTRVRSWSLRSERLSLGRHLAIGHVEARLQVDDGLIDAASVARLPQLLGPHVEDGRLHLLQHEQRRLQRPLEAGEGAVGRFL